MPDPKANDMLARIGAVIGSCLVLIFSYLQSMDRFTGAEGEVLAVRVDRLERDVQGLPPEWLRRDLERIEQRLERIEAFIENELHAD